MCAIKNISIRNVTSLAVKKWITIYAAQNLTKLALLCSWVDEIVGRIVTEIARGSVVWQIVRIIDITKRTLNKTGADETIRDRAELTRFGCKINKIVNYWTTSEAGPIS